MEEIDETNVVVTTAYTYTMEEIVQLYLDNIKEKQVIANQPIRTGETRCTDACDIENHHMHTYYKACKRNLFYGTVVHDCNQEFGRGEIHPGMDPKALVNHLWWKEPMAVQQYNNYIYLHYLQRMLIRAPFYEDDTYEPYIANLD